MRANLRVTVVLAVAMLMTGCQSIGPGSVQRDRLDYAGAISGSWREQTLLNIIKLRYFDTPVFLDVASVVSSYTLQGEVSLGSRLYPFSRNDTFHDLGVTGTYTDRPTISYTPVTGKRYLDSLLRPIPPQAIFAMIQGGHQADYILQATVRAINDVYNYSHSPGRNRHEDPVFHVLIEAIRRIQQAGALNVRVEKRGAEEVTLIYFSERAGSQAEDDIRLVKKMLGINPAVNELPLTFGSPRRSGGEVALLTRSILEILVELSAGVVVPALHLTEGRARRTPGAEKHADSRDDMLVRIHSSREQPQDTFAAVRYRNFWFWIDDRDLASKRAFMFLNMFSSIAETGVAPQLPILTIPAN
jgi:hypothetical protein